MLRNFFLEKLSIPRKDFFRVFILLFNAFTWYYITLKIIEILLKGPTYMQILIVLAVYHIAIIGSSVIGSILSGKIKRLNFLYFWMVLGTSVSFLPVFLNEITITHVLSIYFFWGLSFGLGMPSCLAYFADYTLVENRGRVGGVLFSFVLLLSGMFGLIAKPIILAIWRGFGLIIFFLLKPEEEVASSAVEKRMSFKPIFYNKPFFLYFIPWLMYCFIDRFEEPILEPFLGPIPNFVRMMLLIIGSLSALIGGLLCDWVGRKRVILYGFAALGIAYAAIGIFSAMLVSWYFFLTIGSIASGMLWVAFVLILWGDLSQSGTREKYYVIGNIPFFLTGIIQLLSAPSVALIPESSAFSLASFFLFLAVLLLLYAPETLPERKIELRRLRKYVEAAKKVKEKYKEKGAKG